MLSSGIALMLGAVMAAAASPALPPDIDPESRSRLPVMKREQLDAEGQRVFDSIRGANPGIGVTGPSAVTIYSPGSAEHFYKLNQYLRKTVVGPKYFEVSALIAAREFDQQYEWTSHEPTAVTAGVDRAVIDAIKFNRDVAGLPERDATVIRFGRAIFRDHKVPSDLWAKMVELFGRQGTMEISIIMGDYAMAAVALIAADQHLIAGRQPLLPDAPR